MLHLKLSVLLFVALSCHYFGAAASPYPSRYGLGTLATRRQNVTTRTDRIATTHYFKQRVDHGKFKRIHGSFKQRYWLNARHYKPGGPILLVIAGGDPALKLDVLSTIEPNGLLGAYAKLVEGVCVVLEHRYFGESLPYKDLSEKSLKRLTIEQSIEDLAYFAQNVKFPGRVGLLHPDNDAWILVGSGYAGTLANWAMLKHKEIFLRDTHPLRLLELTNLWEYWVSARKAMKKLSLGKCSVAIQFVAKHIDEVAARNDKKEVAHLKKLLRLDGVTEMVDVAEAVAYSVKLWDGMQPKKSTQFHEFCLTLAPGNRLNNINDTLDKWGEWNQKIFEGENDDAFWGTHDRSHERFTDKNPGRPWFWLQCNELGWFRTAARTKSLMPRLLDIGNERRICSMHFPKTFPRTKKPKPPRIKETNLEFKTERANQMLATVGQYDAWAGTEISFFNTSLDRESLLVAKTGFISSDMYCLVNNHTDDDVFDTAQAPASAILSGWLKERLPKSPPSGWKAWLQRMKQKGSGLKAGRA